MVSHEAPLTSENAMEIISQYDIVVNGADNFPARYLVNDASYLCGKPLVDGSILLFDGQASVFVPGQGLLSLPLPHAATAGRCPKLRGGGSAGGVARHGRQHPGHGDHQANPRARARTLVGRLLLIDALSMEFRTVKLRRNKQCPLCGDNPTIDSSSSTTRSSAAWRRP